MTGDEWHDFVAGSWSAACRRTFVPLYQCLSQATSELRNTCTHCTGFTHIVQSVHHSGDLFAVPPQELAGHGLCPYGKKGAGFDLQSSLGGHCRDRLRSKCPQTCRLQPISRERLFFCLSSACDCEIAHLYCRLVNSTGLLHDPPPIVTISTEAHAFCWPWRGTQVVNFELSMSCAQPPWPWPKQRARVAERCVSCHHGFARSARPANTAASIHFYKHSAFSTRYLRPSFFTLRLFIADLRSVRNMVS